MATPVGYAVLSATLQVTGSSKQYNITCGAAGSGGIDAATMRTRWGVALVGSVASPFYEANMDSSWSVTETKCVKSLAGGALDVAVDPSPQVGTATIQTPSPNVSVLVHKSTGIGGRRYRGRMSVPPCNIAEGDITRAGYLESAALGVQQSYWNYVFTYLAGGGVNPYLLHYPTTLPDGGDFPPAPTPLQAFIVAQLVGSNGSRLR